MRFEFDHKTGMMAPKKDDQIYFAQSQGGGLIIDDKKNNVRFIIERDGRITRLFGNFDKNNLNLYDMRDARTIADRVTRLLGREHKYSDYHYFLRGYHMTESVVKNCTDFLNESTWNDIRKQSANKRVMKEDGFEIGVLEDGTKLIVPNEESSSGELVEFDDGNNYYYLEDADAYIAVFENGNDDTYYRYDPDTDDPINMEYCFEGSEMLRRDDFAILIAIIREGQWHSDDLDGISVDYHISDRLLEFINGRESYYLFWDDVDARGYAFNIERDFLESDVKVKGAAKNYYDTYGDCIFNTDEMSDEINESNGIYFDDLSQEEAIDELLRWKVIEDTEEFFDLDEDGDTDHDLPKFDYTDYRDDYLEKRLDDINDIPEYFMSEFGTEGIEDFMDLDKLTDCIIDSDGVGAIISGYDNEERTQDVNGNTYYIYRMS